MISPFGVDHGSGVSKTFVGAGRAVPASALPAKVRARQLARLKGKKPQVRSTVDQVAQANRDLAGSSRERAGKELLRIGRASRGKVNAMPKDNEIVPKGTGAFVIPDPNRKTNHLFAPRSDEKWAKQALRHEQEHAKVKPKRLASTEFRTFRSRIGEEARADAAAYPDGKVGSDYVLGGGKRYQRVYRKITGKEPKWSPSVDQYRHQLKSQGVDMPKSEVRQIVETASRPENIGRVRQETERALRRRPGFVQSGFGMERRAYPESTGYRTFRRERPLP